MGVSAENELVWVVTYSGVDLPRPSQPGGPPAPAIRFVHVIINATTGRPLFNVLSSTA